MWQLHLSICSFRCPHPNMTAKTGHGRIAHAHTHMHISMRACETCTCLHTHPSVHMPHNVHTHLYNLIPLSKDTLRASRIQMSVPVWLSQLYQEHRQPCSSPSLLSPRYEFSTNAKRERGPHESRIYSFTELCDIAGEVWRGMRHTFARNPLPTAILEAHDYKDPREGT